MPLNTIRGVIDSALGFAARFPSTVIAGRELEHAQDLFTKILDACPHANDLPYIMEVTVWGSGRNNGWEVLYGVAWCSF